MGSMRWRDLNEDNNFCIDFFRFEHFENISNESKFNILKNLKILKDIKVFFCTFLNGYIW